jgi:hypothetical protein
LHQKIYLEDNYYSAIGLSGHDAFLGQGVVLISPTQILKVNDLSFEHCKLAKFGNADLNDQIDIAGSTWAKLKTTAMLDNYREQTWFASLNEGTKNTLESLRTAQRMQGDMNALEPEPIDFIE